MRGYSEVRAISPAELRALYPLACMRVCTTVVMAAHSAKLDPDNAEYLTISQARSCANTRVAQGVEGRGRGGGAASCGSAPRGLQRPHHSAPPTAAAATPPTHHAHPSPCLAATALAAAPASARAVASRAARGCTVQAPAWEALRVLRTIDPQHATAVALEAGGAAEA